MTSRMNFTRRFAMAAALLALGAIGDAGAADYPTRPVRWIVPYPPGGATDILARIIAQSLSERLGQTFVIENKPGAGNNIGTEAVVHAAPDGYTMLLVNPANAINATLYKKLTFNFIRDIAAGRRHHARAQRDGGEPGASRPRRSPSSSPTARPIRARSTWRRRATAPRCTCRASCSRSMTGVDMLHVPYRGAGAGADRPHRRPGPRDVRQHAVVVAAHPGGQAARARRDLARSARRAARRADRRRDRAGLRGQRLVRHRRARRARRATSSTSSTRNQRGARRPEDARRSSPSSAACRSPAPRPTSARWSPTRPRSGRR